ncbi:hypothetical protein AXF42_Ash010648 [Apostasia shenzhenica]|uniref:Uncharacterized protein n=1 Tax=Apostasia shenzhenica TaxID=1088818 RepID=A0A2I0A6P6_9ASPA|nr:hypothetical protein AXF42_Ash010648 [Apostasia shenzhenica]
MSESSEKMPDHGAGGRERSQILAPSAAAPVEVEQKEKMMTAARREEAIYRKETAATPKKRVKTKPDSLTEPYSFKHFASNYDGGQIPATDGGGTGEQSDRGRAEGEDDDDRKEGGGDLLGRDDSAQKEKIMFSEIITSLKRRRHEGDGEFTSYIRPCRIIRDHGRSGRKPVKQLGRSKGEKEKKINVMKETNMAKEINVVKETDPADSSQPR